MGLCNIVPQTHLVAARDYQVRALAPFNAPILRAAPWGTTRKPLTPAYARVYGARLGDIHVGTDPYQPPAADAPERVTYVLTIDADLPTGQVKGISSPALPAPCSIEDVSIQELDNDHGQTFEWQLLLTDTPFSGPITQATGEKLLIPRTLAENLQVNPDLEPWGVPVEQHAVTKGGNVRHMGPLGRLITEPGKYLTFAVFASIEDQSAWISAVITIQRRTH
jgi:hypothetical protein